MVCRAIDGAALAAALARELNQAYTAQRLFPGDGKPRRSGKGIAHVRAVEPVVAPLGGNRPRGNASLPGHVCRYRDIRIRTLD